METVTRDASLMVLHLASLLDAVMPETGDLDAGFDPGV
jgi:hypothetical protein